MSNFIQNLFLIIFGLLALLSILRSSSSSSEGEKLTEKYRTDECCPDTFVSNQQGILKNTVSDTGIVVIRPLNVGVSEKGVFSMA